MINCGIVGCGSVVEDLHIPGLRGLKEVEVTTAIDINHDRLETFGRKYQIRNLYDDFEDFLKADSNVDFLVVSTPGFTHYQLCQQALEAGLNLLVEKPFTLSLKDTLELKALAERQNVTVSIMQNYRYRDAVLKARKDLETGRVGKIRQVNVTWHGAPVFSKPNAWAWDERKHKTLLYETCIHWIDLQTYFAGRVTRMLGSKSSWSKELQSTEKIYAMVEHENDAIGIIDFQFNASSNYTRIEIFGSANDILIKFFPEYYRLYSGNVNPIDELYLDFKRISDFVLPTLREKIITPKVKRRAKSHYRVYKLFVDALKSGRKNVPLSIDDILPTMELAEQLCTIAYGS